MQSPEQILKKNTKQSINMPFQTGWDMLILHLPNFQDLKRMHIRIHDTDSTASLDDDFIKTLFDLLHSLQVNLPIFENEDD